MEQKARLHPLFALAAICISVFSLVGIGAVTGLLPHSTANKVQVEDAGPPAVEQFSSVMPPLPVAPRPRSPAPEVR